MSSEKSRGQGVEQVDLVPIVLELHELEVTEMPRSCSSFIHPSRVRWDGATSPPRRD